MRVDYSAAPDDEWTDPVTGRVYDSKGRFVITPTMLSMEDVWSQDFDREAAGETVEIKPHSDRIKAVKRGTITEFTRDSQVRMMKACASWMPVGRLMLVTVTYPRTFPDAAGAKADLKRFLDIVRREYPNMAGVWKFEYQTRGAPHFHFVFQTGSTFFSDHALRMFRLWLTKAWRRARQTNVSARTEAKFANDDNRAKFYLTKEVGKTAQTSSKWREAMEKEISHEGGGRFWGWHNCSNMVREQQEFAVPARVAFLIRQFIQNEILKNMRERTRKKAGKRVPYLEFREGEWLLPNGKALDENKLPSWHLFPDADPVFARLIKWLQEEHGINFFEVCSRHKANWQRYEEPSFQLVPD